MAIFGRDKEKPFSPIEFGEVQRADSPLVFMDKDLNDQEHNFAILRTTEGGKYVRGNMLYYSLNGVEVYTDINNIIFVDALNKSLFIRESSKVSNEIAPDDPEQKQYIILFTDIDEDNSDVPLRWEAQQGRTNAYESIKANAAVIDIDKSVVLVETVSFKESLTVREFVNYLKNAEYVEEDDFDINDYAGSEYI